MNGEVMELKRPAQAKTLNDFLESVDEDELFAALDAPEQYATQPETQPLTITGIATTALETNSRLTIIKMFEKAPNYGQPFTFCVRKFTGEAYIQSMRTTMSKARRLMRENNLDAGEPFKMLVLALETRPSCDEITVTRSPKGVRNLVKLTELAKMMGGFSLTQDEDEV